MLFELINGRIDKWLMNILRVSYNDSEGDVMTLQRCDFIYELSFGSEKSCSSLVVLQARYCLSFIISSNCNEDGKKCDFISHSSRVLALKLKQFTQPMQF